MKPEQAQFLMTSVLPLLREEAAVTCRVLSAIPEDRRDYRPHSDSRSALELAWHVVSSGIWFLEGVVHGHFSPGDPRMPQHIKSVGDVLGWHSRNIPELLDSLEKMRGDDLACNVPFYGVLNQPAVLYLNLMLVHTAHHRGQVSAYLRPMGARVPSIYGGSADEPFQMAAQG